MTGRNVDLVDAGAVRNPYFKQAAFGSAQDLYHGYTGVDSTIVWQAATQAVPELIPTLEALLAEVAPLD